MKKVAIGAYIISALIFVIGTAWAVFLRDGLGPEMVSSSGVSALLQVIEGAWPAWLISLFFMLLGNWLSRAPKNS